jgi:predicted permease
MKLDPDGSRIHEEMEHHLEELAARLEAEGFSPDEARAEALRRFGDPVRFARKTRAAGAPPLLRASGGLRGDLVQVLRGLRRAPAFTASVSLTLSLALGATAAVFGVFRDVLLRPLAFRDPHGLVALVERMPESGVEESPVSEGTFHDWRRELRSVSQVVAYEWYSSTLEDPERPEHLATVEVSGDLFHVLGVEPLLGRVFTAADEVEGGPPRVLLLSYEFWMRRFGGDPSVVGRSLPIDGTLREVVGVLPPRVDLLTWKWAEIYHPNPHTPVDPTNRGSRTLNVLARLAPGATAADATEEVRAIAARIAASYPTSARGWSAQARDLREHLLGDARAPLSVVMAGVALLLLIAAVNVANLLQVRASDRSREMALRAAVGAGRARLLRLGLVEAGTLGALGTGGGLAIAWTLRHWLASAEPGVLPRALEGGLTFGVVAFATLLGTVVALAVGASAALRGAEEGLSALGRGSGVGTTRRGRRGALVVAQIALTVILLIGAGLLVRTVSALRSVDVGYDPARVVAARVSLDPRRFPGREEHRDYYERLMEHVRAIPGVEAAGITSSLPMDPVAANFDLPTLSDEMEGLGWERAAQVDFRIVGPGLMETLDFRLVRGRTFTDADRSGAPLVALVNRSLAERFWPGEDPIGRRVQSVWRSGQWFEVVGVVEDTRFYGPRRPSQPELFVPLEQMMWTYMTVVARSRGDLAETQAALERAFLATDPLLPPQEVFRAEELIDATRATERFYALLLSGFALLALSLAAAGVYGTFAYTVRRRTKEMGVRLALGARRPRVVGGVLGRGLGLTALGIAAGLAAALPATRAVSGMLFGVEPADPTTIGAVVLVLLVVAGGACLQPALRAARLDPASVLRQD